LIEFGGIYLDQDVYVVKSLDLYRKYEMTLGLYDDGISNNILIGHKNARFLKIYLDSYHEYDSTQWWYNSGEVPTKLIRENPDLVHGVKEFSQNGPHTCQLLYIDYDLKWQKDFRAIHLYMRGNKVTLPNWCLGSFNKNKKYDHFEFNDDNVKNLNTTIGEMCRLVLEFENSIK
jgi:hypothetical protein